VAGTRLRDIAPKVGTAEDTEDWEKVHKDVINRCAARHHTNYVPMICLPHRWQFMGKVPVPYIDGAATYQVRVKRRHFTWPYVGLAALDFLP